MKLSDALLNNEEGLIVYQDHYLHAYLSYDDIENGETQPYLECYFLDMQTMKLVKTEMLKSDTEVELRPVVGIYYYPLSEYPFFLLQDSVNIQIIITESGEQYIGNNDSWQTAKDIVAIAHWLEKRGWE